MATADTGPGPLRGWLLLVLLFAGAYGVRYFWPDATWALIVMVGLIAAGIWASPLWRSRRDHRPPHTP